MNKLMQMSKREEQIDCTEEEDPIFFLFMICNIEYKRDLFSVPDIQYDKLEGGYEDKKNVLVFL